MAKDFGLPTKDVMEILTKYASAPKNHMQALTDGELSVIFDYLTQKNPVSGIQVIYADTYKEEKKPEPEVKAEPAKPAQAAAAPQGRPQQGASSQAKQGNAPQQGQKAPQGNATQQAKPQQTVSRVPQKKIVDTRKGGDVNLAKYDERLEEMGGQRG